MNSKKQKITTVYPSARMLAMSQIMEAIRSPDWNPLRIDVALIETLNVARSKESEAVKTLRFLDLIDEQGVPSEEFQALRHDYQPTLNRIVRENYAPILQQIPSKLITQQSVVKFFMRAGYVEDTAEYQGMLFGWLCREAGIDLPNLPTSFTRARFAKKKNNASPGPTME